MAGKDIIMASAKELRRLRVLHQALEKRITQVEAAEILQLSARQVRRIVAKIREEGDRGIVHGSRGRDSNRSIPKKKKDRVIKLYRERYGGFGPTLAAEKLKEQEGIEISDETLRKWLIGSGDWKKSRKRGNHRRRRDRKQTRGEMVQIDGSHHDWFEGRGAKCVLMGYIDDATGTIFCRFYGYEGTIPAMDSFKRYIRKHGIPLSIYLDKHTTYRSPVKPLFDGDEEGLSQFERAMKELEVEVIHAHSPQAKGRVERLFRTLQDRLVKEMRLRGIKDIAEANRFLGQYMSLHNKRFTVTAVKGGTMHREVPAGLDLDAILCIKEHRVVRNDNTIAYKGKQYQILDRTTASRVMVVEKINGSLSVRDTNKTLRFKELKTMPLKRKEAAVLPKRKKISIPPAQDHPWRRYKCTTKGNTLSVQKDHL